MTTLYNRRITDRPQNCPLQAAIDKGVAHLRSNPDVPVSEAVAVVLDGAK